MKTKIILSSGKEVDLNEPNCLLELSSSEFQELLFIVRQFCSYAEAA